MSGKKNILLFGLVYRVLNERPQGRYRHHRRIENLACFQRCEIFQNSLGTVISIENDPELAFVFNGGRIFRSKEIAAAHVCNRSFRIRSPNAHSVRICLRVVLYGFRSAPVGIAFSKHRIYGTSQHFCIPLVDSCFFVRFGFDWIIRNCKALLPELGDSVFKLRNGSRNVWQLDDVGFRFCSQFT